MKKPRIRGVFFHHFTYHVARCYGQGTVLRGFEHQSGLFEIPIDIRPQPVSARHSTSAATRKAPATFFVTGDSSIV
jgi:hypothetical protein